MDKKELEKRIIDVLKSCYDPEIPVDIYELGLIYEIKMEDRSQKTEEGNIQSAVSSQQSEVSNLPGELSTGTWDVEILMTLTSPNCPVAESLPMDVENKVKSMDGVKSAKVTITFDPPWDKSMMSEEAQVELGFM